MSSLFTFGVDLFLGGAGNYAYLYFWKYNVPLIDFSTNKYSSDRSTAAVGPLSPSQHDVLSTVNSPIVVTMRLVLWVICASVWLSGRWWIVSKDPDESSWVFMWGLAHSAATSLLNADRETETYFWELNFVGAASAQNGNLYLQRMQTMKHR